MDPLGETRSKTGELPNEVAGRVTETVQISIRFFHFLSQGWSCKVLYD